MQPQANHGPYDLVIAMSILEHIDRPWIAAPNISALVAPGGHLFVAMPWFYPVHEGPDFGDHWRATPSGLKILFDDLELVRQDWMPSPILVAWDRKNYYSEANSTSTGSVVMFRRSAV